MCNGVSALGIGESSACPTFQFREPLRVRRQARNKVFGQKGPVIVGQRECRVDEIGQQNGCVVVAAIGRIDPR